MSNYDLFGDYEPEQPAMLEEDWPEPEPERPKRPRRKRSGRGGGGLYNLIAALFLIATIAVVVLTVMLVQNPTLPLNPFPPPPPQATPTLFLLDPPGASGGVVPTQTAAPTSTRVPTLLPQLTQSQTTPTATLDGTSNPADLTARPAITNTASIEPFTLQNEAVTYTQHPDGCDSLWIVGQVLDIEQKPLKGLAVIARWNGNSALGWSGYATQWGTSGYEIYINNKPVELEVEVQLLAGTGQPLSEPVVVRTLATCDRNVAIANFIQNHIFSP